MARRLRTEQTRISEGFSENIGFSDGKSCLCCFFFLSICLTFALNKYDNIMCQMRYTRIHAIGTGVANLTTQNFFRSFSFSLPLSMFQYTHQIT